MSFKFGTLSLVVAAMFVGAPALAARGHVVVSHPTHPVVTHPAVNHNVPVLSPTFCGEDISDVDAYSRIDSHHGLIYEGGIHDDEAEIEVGFQILVNGIDNFSFVTTVNGEASQDVVYGYDFSGGYFSISDSGINVSETNRGVSVVTFQRRNSGLSPGDIIGGIFYDAFGDDFDVVADHMLVNGHTVTTHGLLTEECTGASGD